MKVKKLCVLLSFICILNIMSVVTGQGLTKASASDDDTVRAVWAATAFSLDYPSAPTTSMEILKNDADYLLNHLQSLGYNTLFFQVRPSGDAFYKSDIFPWSKYLTGQQGVAPEYGFDPLEYITTEAHKRGISVHAWINPYRVTASATDKANLANNSILGKNPELVVEHTDGKLYLNPGEPAANQLIVDGALEIIRKYAVDGIHIDDYFYPKGDFPDSETYKKYGGGYSDIGDWRRNNVTSLIASLYSEIKAQNSEIIFSVSPSGIWANQQSHPDGSNTLGSQSYYDYYADSRLWVQAGILDWIMPQIYWNFGNSAADFETVANWWSSIVAGTNVKLCIGQAIYKASDETDFSSPWHADKGVEELKRQNDFIKNLNNYIGYSHYRLNSTLKTDRLINYAKMLNNVQPTPAANQLFSDISAYPWAQDAIIALNQKGIVNGMDDGSFGASRQVTRADFTLMLVRLLGADAAVTENFADVSPEKYYYHQIGVAKALGITNGRDGTIFDPTGNITREDMATMVYRILENYGKLNYDGGFALSDYFSDAANISKYAQKPVAALCGRNLLSGYETGEFLPQGLATRAEAAVFLERVSRLFN